MKHTEKLGTFSGVFVPNILTIMGVIIFLRVGWVVGTAGLDGALLILLICFAITLLTGFSLSAISTNAPVGAGGAYFLISRSLGLEIGGSIGVPLFLAQSLGIAFYIMGFVESLKYLGPMLPQNWRPIVESLPPRLVGMLVLSVFLLLAWRGIGAVLKAQYFILAILALSLLAFFVGYTGRGDLISSLGAQYPQGYNFWAVLAVFFPPMTGIMTGLSMSGDLKNPSQSIPRGTLYSLLFTLLLYGWLMIWLALNASRPQLLETSLIMRDIAVVPAMIFVGVWAATLSSALAVILAAPRSLAALAADGLAPSLLAQGQGPNHEPRTALLASALLAAVGIFIGELNLLATLLTMFYLATFGTINLVAALEALVSNPSYRPTFKVHWSLSMLGAIACIQAMFLISPPMTLLAVAVIAGIYLLLARRRMTTSWGDMRSGFWFAMARLGLLRLAVSREHPRNWRPVLLVLAGHPKQRHQLIQFANYFEARRGLMFLGQVVTGDWDKLLPRIGDLEQAIRDFASEQKLAALPQVVLADNFEKGVVTLLQTAGLGPLKPNTTLIGWSDDSLRQESFGKAILRILQMRHNLLVYSQAQKTAEQLEPRIDLWWHSRLNGALMLLLADLLRSDARWRQHRIRVIRVVGDAGACEQARTDLNKHIAELRIECDQLVLVSKAPIFDVIAQHSAQTEVCFLGIDLNRLNEQSMPLEPYAPLIRQLLGHTFLTKSWHDLQLFRDPAQPSASPNSSASGKPSPDQPIKSVSTTTPPSAPTPKDAGP